MKILVFGNSGSGKSTYAKAMARRHALAHLDLDTIVWEPGKVAVQRSTAAIEASLDTFLRDHPRWIIEGCYGELVAAAAAHCDELVFLNPGRETCLTNNRRRPWEPHKYASPQAQDAMLENLQAWVAGYYERDDDWSYRRHRQIYDAHPGKKTRIRAAAAVISRHRTMAAQPLRPFRTFCHRRPSMLSFGHENGFGAA